MYKTDFLIIGAGIVGLSIANELKKRYPAQSITVLEKECTIGLHSSGRNSGVLHSGIYYPPTSLKAQVCSQGAKLMAEFCLEHKLPLNKIGKVLVPVRSEDASQLAMLAERAEKNEIEVEQVDEFQLQKLEPDVRSATGNALYVPSTSVIDSKLVLDKLLSINISMGIKLIVNTKIKKIEKQNVVLEKETIHFGHVVNAAGLHADLIAHLFGVGFDYTLLPFKGIYWKLDPKTKIKINHLVYPVPDLRVPFLGVHTTTSIDGDIYLGPTAVPAFGRENYRGLKNIESKEFVHIVNLLSKQFVSNQDGFRRLAWQEGRRYFKHWFVEAASALVPKIKKEDLLICNKVGIRAQMLNAKSGKLVTDFVVQNGLNSTHILNAISPAFTSSFAFAKYVVDDFIEKG